ncbi:MAG: type IV pilus secretin PilQ [Gammaproteobacteria bacterium]|jgi:type IV pilus assembly protein PilQ
MYKCLLILLCLITLPSYGAKDPFAAAYEAHQKNINTQITYVDGLISLHLVQAEIHQVLQQFAQLVHLNISVNDNVTGNVSVHLNHVPWPDALLAILQPLGLDYQEINHVIYIAPHELLTDHQTLQALKTDYIRIHYAKAQALAELIKSKENSLLSERGQVSVDLRTNTLILQDMPKSLPPIYELIRELDIPVQQVMIEARIVNAKHSFTRDLGINFNISSEGSDIIFNAGSNISDFMTYDLPQTMSSTSGLAVAKLSSDILIDLEISASESEDKTKVIASPRLITANQSEAVIRQGKQIAVEESTSSGATSVSFRDAVLELSVIPHITPNDKIILQLDVKQDVLGHFTETGQPTIDTKSISTQVLVDNGATIVLGGIYSRTESNNINRLPFLSALPLLGKLFQHEYKLQDRDELLIFVTPTIVREDSQ